MATIGPIQNLYNLRMARALPPVQGGGLSAMPNIDQPLPAPTSTDPIQSGIDTLMAYGRQATGQEAGLASMIGPTGAPMMARGGRVLRFSNGGSADDADSMDSGVASMGPGHSDPGQDFEGSYEGYEQYSPENIAATMLGEDIAAAVDAGKAQGFDTKVTGRDVTFIGPDGRTSTYTVGPKGGFFEDLFSMPESTAGKIGKVGTSIAGLAPGLGLVKGIGSLLENVLGPQSPEDLAASAKMGFDFEREADSRATGDGAPVRPYGDPYNAPTPKAESLAAVAEPDTFFRREARLPLTLSDIVGYATGQPGYEGGFPRFLPAVAAAQGGGISALAYGGDTAPAGYANKAFEGMVPGQGSGMSDSVPFSIEGQQPALLSRDEYVLPADVVSQLGDGSSGAGADMLDSFVSQVRQAKYGNTQQPPAVGGGLMSALMRHGGLI